MLLYESVFNDKNLFLLKKPVLTSGTYDIIPRYK